MTALCTICQSPFDIPGRPWTVDCGGDCLACMAEAGDPDCVARLAPVAAIAEVKPCFWCRGSGKVLEFDVGDVDCPACKGSGRNREQLKLVPSDPIAKMIAAMSISEWIGHPEARPETIERWRKGQRDAAVRLWKAGVEAAPSFLTRVSNAPVQTTIGSDAEATS